MEDKKLEVTPAVPISDNIVINDANQLAADATAPTLYKAELPERVVKDYLVNSKNLELFLDVPPTDDNYYQGINKRLPVGSSNGLAYIDDGQGTVLKIQFVKREYSNKKKKEQAEQKEAKEEESADTGRMGSLTHTGRLGEVMKESVEVVKIAVFNFLA